MIQGHVKREKHQRRLRKWATIVRYLPKLDGKFLSYADLNALPDKAMVGFPFTRADRSQIHAILTNLAELGPHGYRFLPSKLEAALKLLPPIHAPQPKVEPARIYVTPTPPIVTPAVVMEKSVDEKPVEPSSESVTLTHILVLTAQEAKLLLSLRTPGGNLPDTLPPGSATKLGSSFVHLLKQHELFTSVGRAKGARLLVDQAKWEKTQINIAPKRSRNEHRYKSIPSQVKSYRPAHSWMDHLARDLHDMKEAGVSTSEELWHKPPPAAEKPAEPVQTTSYVVGRKLAVELLEAQLLKAQDELNQAIRDAQPFVDRIEFAKKKTQDLTAAIEAVKKSRD